MALQRKLGRPTDQREALLRNQVSELLWNGKIETTYARAKEVSKLAEKILTLAINTYTDTVKKIETRKNNKGQDIKVELVNDGAKKLAARRKIMAKVYDLQEQRKDNETKANFIARTENIRHPLIEKIFNEYAPKYATRKGGYTRIVKIGQRKGDGAMEVVLELI